MEEIDATIAAGQPVPEPSNERHRGRILLRLPRSLHGRLAELAEREDVSLNQLAATMLAEAIGRLSGAPRDRPEADVTDAGVFRHERAPATQAVQRTEMAVEQKLAGEIQQASDPSGRRAPSRRS